MSLCINVRNLQIDTACLQWLLSFAPRGGRFGKVLLYLGDKLLIPKTIGNRKRRLCVKLFWVTNTTWEHLQIATHKSVSTPQLYWFVRCNLQIFSGCVCHLEQLHAQSPFLFPIVFGINLIPFFDIGSVLAVLCWGIRSLLGPLRGLNCHCLWLWQPGFHVSLRAAMSNLSLSPQPPLKQRPGCAQRWKKAQDCLLFTNQRCPRISTYKFAAFRYRLPTILQTVRVSIEPRLSAATHKAETALKDRSVAP